MPHKSVHVLEIERIEQAIIRPFKVAIVGAIDVQTSDRRFGGTQPAERNVDIKFRDFCYQERANVS